MNHPNRSRRDTSAGMSVKAALGIAASMALAAMFPLLGLLAGAFVVGAAVQQHFTAPRPRTPGVGEVTTDPETLGLIRKIESKTTPTRRKYP